MLQATDIGRRAGGQWLLRDVSCTIRGGDRLAIVGRTGSGKTLLLRALALLDRLGEGQVCWRGQVVSAHDIPRFRSQVMYLHQRSTLRPGTVEENLRQPFQLAAHRDRSFDRPRIVTLLGDCGRDESFLAKQQADLSGGESQLAALLRAMQLDPAVLLLDEPTASLDAETTQQVEQLLGGWRRQPSSPPATVWVTHDARQAERVADQIWRMDKGQLQGQSERGHP